MTSERYLGDGFDSEIVRSAPERRLGIEALIHQAWVRYCRPIVVTEAHLGYCDVDEQKRWLGEMWLGAERARAKGIDVRAVCAWALFGLVDWHNLLTRQENLHEPGVFAIQKGRPVDTGLTTMVRAIAAGQSVAGLMPRGPGWWEPNTTITPQLALALI